MVNNVVEHIFKNPLGAAYGFSVDAEPSTADDKCGVLTFGVHSVAYVLHFWHSPDDHELLISLDFRCPCCSFPLSVRATQAGIAQDDENGLTMRTPVTCPAHWEDVNAAGQTLGRRVSCGWRGLIRDDALHVTSCSASNFNYTQYHCSCQPQE